MIGRVLSPLIFPMHAARPCGSVWDSGTPHRRTTHSHISITHNRTSPLSRVDGIGRLECSRPAQGTLPNQTAAKNHGATDDLTPHLENRPNGTALDIVVHGHLKRVDKWGASK